MIKGVFDRRSALVKRFVKEDRESIINSNGMVPKNKKPILKFRLNADNMVKFRNIENQRAFYKKQSNCK